MGWQAANDISRSRRRQNDGDKKWRRHKVDGDMLSLRHFVDVDFDASVDELNKYECTADQVVL